MDTDSHEKKINILGTNNRYMIKKLIKGSNEKEIKKRVICEEWNFSDEYFKYYKQIELLKNISLNNFICNDDNVSKIVFQELNKKISSYKQQDVLKKHFNNDKFINFNNIVMNLIDCELMCRYCKEEMTILYDISREMKQWSVDRIDNDKGHNNDNFHLACLECNLKRRRRTDEKFLFTKQLTIIKQDR
jgi:hypothetical protein